MTSALAIAALATGCSSWIADEPVTIDADPGSALVYAEDGRLLGATPLTLTLERNKARTFRLERPGFVPYQLVLMPARTAAGQSYPRFGILEDTGRYSRLEPNPATAELIPELLPASLGADPVAELAERTLAADKLLESGQISVKDHDYIVRYLADYYLKN